MLGVTDIGQQQVSPVTIARQFYKHALRTLAMVVAAFGTAGSVAFYVLFATGDYHPAYGIVTFLSWGCFAAAIVLAVRKPPF